MTVANETNFAENDYFTCDIKNITDNKKIAADFSKYSNNQNNSIDLIGLQSCIYDYISEHNIQNISAFKVLANMTTYINTFWSDFQENFILTAIAKIDANNTENQHLNKISEEALTQYKIAEIKNSNYSTHIYSMMKNEIENDIKLSSTSKEQLLNVIDIKYNEIQNSDTNTNLSLI